MSEPQPATPAAADWEAFYANYRKPGYVPGYELTSKLGGGQFGIVFRARKQSIGKDYAIKFLQVDDGEVRRAIVAELEQLKYFAQIDHPNLVSIEDRGEVDGIPYLVMSFAGTETLRDRIFGDGKAPTGEERDQLVQFFLQACRGVAALHDRSLVHFDLKPANVFLKGNVARVGDYGLSKLVTHSRGSLSMGRGTPYYMAPELLQRRGDARSDVYSLGVMLFEILCGRLPFTGDSEWEVLKKHEEAPLEVPAHVGHTERAVLQRCMAKDPAARFQSVAEVLAAFGAPTGAGAAAWSEVRHGADDAGFAAGPSPGSAAPPPPPDDDDPYAGFRRASREAWENARKIAKDASQNARKIAKRAHREAREAWREVAEGKARKTRRRVAAWQRMRSIHRARRERERAERRLHTRRGLRTAAVFLATTFVLAVGLFLFWSVAAPQRQVTYVGMPDAPRDVSSAASVAGTESPAQPIPIPNDPAARVLSTVSVPEDLVAEVSRGEPEWLGKLQIDVAAARDELHARLARIEELQQQAAMLREVSVPRFRVQYGLPPTEQVEMRRQLDQLLDAKKWQPQVAAELRQFAPEVLALAANELAVTPPDGSGNERAARLRRFLEQITGYRGLRPEGENRLGAAQLAKVNAELGNLWMWYLNEVAPSKQVWDASQRVR
ncbi:MAG: protein kinase [Planctomycetes bacterium]|nr:protein kinase [Planctomycetota bacterium]